MPVHLVLLAGLSAFSERADGAVPRPDHVVIVIEENHAYKQIIGSSSAPYINSLAQQGALFTKSFAVTHPSQPNYLALFSGSTHGVGDECPHTFTTPNLGSELLAAGFTFVGYAESLPATGSIDCNAGNYRRKHNPWVNFSNVPSNLNQPATSFPSDFNQLPDLCFLVPNVDNDMHDGTIAEADDWLQRHIDPYVRWAKAHNSLLVLTFDEDDDSQNNQIVTLFVGAMVQPGQYNERIDHYDVLRTLLDMFGLAPMGKASSARAITDVWSTVSHPLTVSIQGNGTVTPDLSQQSLEVGRTYTLVATPMPGNFFAGWSGAVTSRLARLTFVMTPGMALEAHFIPNPFPASAGRYNGLFYESDAVRLESSGALSIVTTGRGTFTGTLQMGGSRFPVIGQFDENGRATNTINRQGAGPLTLELSLDLGAGSDQMQGRVTDGAWVASLQADKAVSKADGNSPPVAGAYTVDLPPEAGSSGPAGDSIGTVTVDANGNVRLAGMLADGTRLTRAGPLSKEGRWPVRAPLYGGKGALLGWVMFAPGADPELSGRVSWIKQPLATSRFYPGGFTNESLAAGSIYHRPQTAGASVVTFTNGVVAFNGGDLSAPFSNHVRIGANSKVTNLSTNRLTLTFALRTGLWTGSVIDPTSGQRLSMRGVIQQPRNAGVGYFLGPTRSGQVQLQEAP